MERHTFLFWNHLDSGSRLLAGSLWVRNIFLNGRQPEILAKWPQIQTIPIKLLQSSTSNIPIFPISIPSICISPAMLPHPPDFG